MRFLELEGQDPRAWGRAHGEAFAPMIRDIAEIRLGLCVEIGAFERPEQVLATAERHLPVLERYCPELYEELLGIAEGSSVDPARIIVLNHYTDLRDLHPDEARLADDAEDDCSAVFARTPASDEAPDGGALLGQTWDMHGSAEPYVITLQVPRRGSLPPACLFTITGCLGMTGMNAAGVGITINNLKSLDARVGVVWPALVRRALFERSAEAARDLVMKSPLGSGHHYLVASESAAFGIETSGTRRTLVYDGSATSFVHTNHCLDERVGEVTTVAATSTTQRRYDALTQSIERAPVSDRADLWSRLGSHDGYPQSVCTHLANPTRPHAMRTCGGLVMDLRDRSLWVTQGCMHRARPHALSFGSGPGSAGED